MRAGFVTLALVLLLAVWTAAGAAGAQLPASKPEVRKAVISVIDAQLSAFRAGEMAAAYGYAAASLRAQTSLRAFVAIVQMNYPEIWMNKRAEYGLVRDDGSRARVLVQVFAEEGNAAFEYVLIRERGGWRVGSIMRHDPRQKANA
jgi:hypothetical protein